MTKVVRLNNIDHAMVRVEPRFGAEHGDLVNQITLFPTEIATAQADFPILFRRDANGNWLALALLGFDRDENLFFEDGRWTSPHVPMIQRRGPFLIGMAEAPSDDLGAMPMVHLDLDDPRVIDGGNVGYPLFRTHGGSAPYLEQVTETLRTIHVGAEMATAIYPQWEEAGLLAPVTLDIVLDDGTTYQLRDYHIIGQAALGRLTDETLGSLHRQGFLEPAFMAAASMRNTAKLIGLKNARNMA